MGLRSKIILLFLIIFFVSSCAPLRTKGSFPELKENFRAPTVRRLLGVRFLHRYQLPKRHKIIYDEIVEPVIVKDLQETGYFSNVKTVRCDQIFDPSAKDEEDQGQTTRQPHKIDKRKIEDCRRSEHFYYFLNIRQTTYVDEGNPHEGYLFWGAIHLVSLGVIPLRLPIEVDLTFDLYNHQNKVLAHAQAKDKSVAWAWLPFIFFNGFKPIDRNLLSGADMVAYDTKVFLYKQINEGTLK